MRRDLTSKKQSVLTHTSQYVAFPLTSRNVRFGQRYLFSSSNRYVNAVNNPVAIWENLARQAFTKRPKPENNLFQVQTNRLPHGLDINGVEGVVLNILTFYIVDQRFS